MARMKKPTGRFSSGPWTYHDLRRAIESQGCVREEAASHPQWRHPTRPGKVSLDERWTAVKTGQVVFDALARQTGYGRSGMRRLLNGLPPDS